MLWVGHNALSDMCKFNDILNVKICKPFQVNNRFIVCLGTEGRVDIRVFWDVWRFPTLAVAFEGSLMRRTQVYHVAMNITKKSTTWIAYVAQKFELLRNINNAALRLN